MVWTGRTFYIEMFKTSRTAATAEIASDSDALGGLYPPSHSGVVSEPRHDASAAEPNPVRKQRVQTTDQWLGSMDTSIPKLLMNLSASLNRK